MIKVYRKSYFYFILATCCFVSGLINLLNFFEQETGLFLLPVIIFTVLGTVILVKGLVFDPNYSPRQTEITKEQAIDEVNARVVQIKTRGMSP